MELMGALQPDLPSPSAIPHDHYKVIIDLKDCFFTIPLYPEDQKRFAFSVPSTNFKEPFQRYQWTVLPQGMANSPILCQKYVAQAIMPTRQCWGQMYIVHYMDDILVSGQDPSEVLTCVLHLKQNLVEAGLQIAPQKVKLQEPYMYLGFQLSHNLVRVQKPALRIDNLHTLNDFQKLLGDINWLRPYLKLTTGELKPLFDILQGPSDPTSPRALTLEARQALTKVEQAVADHSVHNVNYSKPLDVIIFHTELTPTEVFWQGHPILWLHLPSSPRKVLLPYYEAVAQLIVVARTTGHKLYGRDPSKIIQSYSKSQVNWLLQNSNSWLIACASFSGIIDNHLPPDKLLQFCNTRQFIFPQIIRKEPIPSALTVFTDGSSNGTVAYVCRDSCVSFVTPHTSAQLVELEAILKVLSDFHNQPLNIYTDSSYLAQSIPALETVSFIKPSSTASVLFQTCQRLIRQHTMPFHLGHLRAHSGLPGPLVQGNALADAATRGPPTLLVDSVQQAEEEHALHHLNSHSLRVLYRITREQARQIVKNCPSCPTFVPVPSLGVNPRGLLQNAIWQMDVTHHTPFGRMRFIHVSVDTFSGFLMATLQSGEATRIWSVYLD
ncbi:PREDICTED: endogenous retrovirus group K member 8 Pol protein-like [Condylura cristata]|uniref:endogenous retrovirus group K member 8 Pol protein-like n=1 Tax=Condylura cristata TaxID=143302 RepID=UPI00064387AB|nr:PREDICTED: endogenous retrovirus group K member 8 Pol protein-like [Condylura cristata]